MPKVATKFENENVKAGSNLRDKSRTFNFQQFASESDDDDDFE